MTSGERSGILGEMCRERATQRALDNDKKQGLKVLTAVAVVRVLRVRAVAEVVFTCEGVLSKESDWRRRLGGTTWRSPS
jgi:hypothetical protein